MDIELLKTFLEVRRLRNFRAAAEKLHLTQAAVSSRIKQLESTLDAPLFIREKNNICLTAAGEQLVPHAESIMLAWQQARQEINLNLTTDFSLSLAARTSILEQFSNRILATIDHPSTGGTLKIDAFNDDIVIKRLLNQTLDVALMYHTPDLDGLTSLPIGSFEIALQNPKSKTLSQALGEDYIHVDWGKDLELLHISKLGFKNQPKISTNQQLVAKQFISKYGGSAFLPLAPKGCASEFKIVEDAPRLTRKVFAVWHLRNPSCELIQTLMTSLSDDEIIA